MELLFAIRGHKTDVETFIDQLHNKWATIKLKRNKKGELDPKGTEREEWMQTGVRPYAFYGVSFPKEFKDIMLTTVLGQGEQRSDYGKFNVFIKMARKFLGLKPVGDWDKSKQFPIIKQNFDIIPIGIKEDSERGWGEGV